MGRGRGRGVQYRVGEDRGYIEIEMVFDRGY
jgi:hypothetical protein